MTEVSLQVCIRHITHQQNEKLPSVSRKKKGKGSDRRGQPACSLCVADGAKATAPTTVAASDPRGDRGAFMTDSPNLVMEMQAGMRTLHQIPKGCLSDIMKGRCDEGRCLCDRHAKDRTARHKVGRRRVPTAQDQRLKLPHCHRRDQHKVKSRHSCIYFQKLEEVSQRSNKATNILLTH